MEMLEDQTEHLKEHINHEVRHSAKENNIMLYAITSAFYAIFSAISALFAGHYSNEAMIEQIKASDQWSYYQAKSIKLSVTESKIELQKSLKVKIDKETLSKIERYKSEITSISAIAKEKEELSKMYLQKHLSFAKSVTMFQIAIVMTAFAILIKRKNFWYMSLLFAMIGIIFLTYGYI